MTAIDKTVSGQTDSISFEFDLSHPPAKVWRALTEPALVSQWLLEVAHFDLTPGADFKMKTEPFPGWDGVVDCRFHEITAERKLVYSWDVGPMGLHTVVTFTLTPTPSGTHLSMVQSGFKPEQKQNFGGARYGWKLMGGKLVDLLGKTS